MLTLHRARADAVVIDGDRIAALGPYDELDTAYGDRARLRSWDGVLTPGRHEPDAPALLEAAYWPDPREDLGSDPLTGRALAALGMTEVRWGASARRGLQRLLAAGTTSVAGPFTRETVRTAVERSGLRVFPGGVEDATLLVPGPLAVSGRADFAVYDDDGACLVTCVAGRMVHRAR
ncbi:MULTISPECIES: imidazolonepropionase-like domain-containing protein [unclassified Streptomyces]|uniref:imidazolonepropionase-like domain-containing protein n=1 Tax=unclassified Streptomyces TaxID=2593676 RepID=UPI0032533E83